MVYPTQLRPVISAKGRISAALRCPEPLRLSAWKARKMRLSRALGPLGPLGAVGGWLGAVGVVGGAKASDQMEAEMELTWEFPRIQAESEIDD